MSKYNYTASTYGGYLTVPQSINSSEGVNVVGVEKYDHASFSFYLTFSVIVHSPYNFELNEIEFIQVCNHEIQF
jgi:hypothetical protein